MIGNTIHQIIPHELFDEEMNIRNSIGKGDSVSHFETKRIKKDGQVIDVSLVVSPIRDAKGQVIGASKVLRDITERKKAEQQLIAHNAVLSEIAFLQSHIVRRPVANVLGIINLLNLENPSDPTNIELIPMLETASKELDSVISQIVEKTNKLEQ
jgi:signal transduction histidine kinase